MYRTIQMRLQVRRKKDNSEHTEVNVIGISSSCEKVLLCKLYLYFSDNLLYSSLKE